MKKHFVSGSIGRCSKMKSQQLNQIARVLISIGLILSTMATGVPSVASADTPETANEYFETFRSLQGTSAFQSYSEFETIRTFAVTRSQEVGSLNIGEQRELQGLLTLLQSFRNSYQSSQAGEFEEALTQAEEVEAAIDTLEDEGASTEASLAQLGLTRYYESVASDAQTEADSTQRTPEEVALLTVAANAYDRAGLPNQAAQFTAQVERMESEYEFATEDMESATTEGQSFLSTCTNCEDPVNALASNPITLFSQYSQVQSVRNEVNDALEKAEIHGVVDDQEQLTQTKGQIDTAWTTLAVSTSFILLAYSIILALISTIVMTKLFSWKRDLDNVDVARVVAGGDTNV